MSTVDKQRIAAVTKLEELGYAFSLPNGWHVPWYFIERQRWFARG